MVNFDQWNGFKGRLWKEEINVRDFVQNNYKPYDGDESFLEGPTEATNKLWGRLQELQKEERAKGGVLDMETKVVAGLTAYGPGYIDESLKGLEKVVSALRMIAPELPFEIRYIELTGPEEDMEINGYHIHAFKVNHNISCYGYTVEIRRAGRFDVERARNNQIPQKLWNPLQKGQTVTTEDGITFTPDMVLGAPRKGIKVTYCTDTRPTENIVKCARHSDLFICEGMYAEKDKIAKAKQYKHMTFYEAADMAKRAGVEEMWLTHFSPSLVHAEDYMPEVKKIFPNAYLGKDGKSVELLFDENE